MSRLTTKRCSMCGEFKPTSEYHASQEALRQGRCKSCDRVRNHAISLCERKAGSREAWRRLPRTRRVEMLQQAYRELQVGAETFYRMVRKPEPVRVHDTKIDEVRQRNAEDIEKFHDTKTKAKEGFVYIVTNPAWSCWVKVGAAIDPEDRVASYQTGAPFRDYELAGWAYTPDRYLTEALAHKNLADQGFHQCGEWFNCPVSEAAKAINVALGVA